MKESLTTVRPDFASPLLTSHCAGVETFNKALHKGALNLENDNIAKAKAKQDKIDRVRLRQADDEAGLSNCVKHAVGCVITDVHGRIVSTGRNGAPAGAENCSEHFHNYKDLINKNQHIVKTGNRSQQIYAQGRIDLANAEHHNWSSDNEIHAEANAIMHSSPEKRMGGTLYVNLQPCPHCAKLIAGSGVSRVVFGKMYGRTNDSQTEKLFKDVGIQYIFIPNFLE